MLSLSRSQILLKNGAVTHLGLVDTQLKNKNPTA